MRDGSFKLAVSRVVLEHVHHVIDRDEGIVDRHDLEKGGNEMGGRG